MDVAEPLGPPRRHKPALFQVGAKYGNDFFDFFLTPLRRDVLCRHMLTQVTFQNFRHQAGDRASDGGDLLKHLAAIQVLPGLDEAFETVRLALDAAHSCKKTLLTSDGVRHGLTLSGY
jgi:hypothetical protein